MNIKPYLLFNVLIFIGLSHQGAAQVDHWETVVNFDYTWKYWTGTSEPDSNWRKLSFNDASWAQGPGGVGFGDGDDNTIIPLVPSVYLRHIFNITDTSAIVQALLNIDYDDGFIAYINNVEIARSNLGSGNGDLPAYNQYATGQHEAQMYQGGAPEGFILSKTRLRACLLPGNNVLAVTVHNATANSPDMSSLIWLHVGVNVPWVTYNPNPAWFTDPISSSDLPLVVLETNGKSIIDTARITANMGIIYNGPGNRNYLSDPFNDYNGRIAIEIRGSTSQQYPKKSYGVETQDSSGNNNNVSLLGMPAENDWIFYAPYPDKTLMRNTLAYHLYNSMQHYNSKTRFCELIINGEYKGVYEIHESIKIDNNRLDLAKLDNNDNAGDSLTGGYVIKIDKTTGNGGPNWTSPLNNDVYFQFHDPEETELTVQQKAYIENFVTDFEYALNGPSYADPQNGYRKYIDVQSFMDFMILQEVGRTVDGYRSSSFLHKQIDSRGGRLSAGPVWDFNLSFGNADYCDAYLTSGWQYQFNNICPGYVPEIPFWWSKFLQDPRFQNELRCRWNDLRAGPLHTDTLMNWIDSVAVLLNESKERNFERWPILGVYVNWNYYVGNTYTEEVTWLKNWVTQRLAWLDVAWPSGTPVCSSLGASNILVSEVNYNSASFADAGDWFELYNNSSVPVDISEWIFKDENPDHYFAFPFGTSIAPGGYLVVCQDTALFASRFPFITSIAGPFSFGLDNDADLIRIYDKGYRKSFQMHYEDASGWPVGADGGGYTLEVLNAASNPNDPANWFTGCPEGSPGGPYITPCQVSDGTALLTTGFNIYPNPFDESVILQLPSGMDLTGLYTEWYDLTGKLLRRIPVSKFNETVETSALRPGIYFCALKGPEGVISYKKIIKSV